MQTHTHISTHIFWELCNESYNFKIYSRDFEWFLLTEQEINIFAVSFLPFSKFTRERRKMYNKLWRHEKIYDKYTINYAHLLKLYNTLGRTSHQLHGDMVRNTRGWALYYHSGLMLSQSFQPMAKQLSTKAVLLLAKIPATASCRFSNTGPSVAISPAVWYIYITEVISFSPYGK